MTDKKIMIIDDDKESLEELSEMLSLNGYEVTSLSEANTALKQTLLLKPNLILLDLKIKGKNGFQIADKLRQSPATNNIPIIAISGYYTRDIDTVIMNSCGIRKFIKKPFKPLDVIMEIEKSLDNL